VNGEYKSLLRLFLLRVAEPSLDRGVWGRLAGRLAGCLVLLVHGRGWNLQVVGMVLSVKRLDPARRYQLSKQLVAYRRRSRFFQVLWEATSRKYF
jgi:hypothetical protein